MTGLNLSGAELAKKALFGGGMSAGAVITYELIEIAKTNPRVLETALSWGPLFVLFMLGMVMVDRRIGDGVSALKDNAKAQQSMSDAMRQIARRDDRQAEKLETLTSYSALQSEKVLNHLADVGSRLDEHGYMLAQISEVLKTRVGAIIARTEPAAVAAGAVNKEQAKAANA